MRAEAVIIIAEPDDSCFSMIKSGFRRAGISNEIIRFCDGQATLGYIFVPDEGCKLEGNREYLLLLEMDLPKTDGAEVLKRVKEDGELKKVPVIMLTSVDDAETVERCHSLGCSMYIVKPGEPEGFSDVIQKIGLFLLSVEIPQINGVERTSGIFE